MRLDVLEEFVEAGRLGKGTRWEREGLWIVGRYRTIRHVSRRVADDPRKVLSSHEAKEVAEAMKHRKYGTVVELCKKYGVSRRTIYRIGERGV